LHGTFDFVLFLLGSLDAAYNTNGNPGYDIASGVVSIALTIGGIVWAYYSYTDVSDRSHLVR